MSSFFLCESKRKAVPDMHSFSANNYLSSFFRKGKKVVWKLILKNEEFIETFSHLGLFTSVTEEVSDSLEKCICQLYGYKNESSVDKVRFKMFQGKGKQDLSLLPPCKSNLKYHIMQENYVANKYINIAASILLPAKNGIKFLPLVVPPREMRKKSPPSFRPPPHLDFEINFLLAASGTISTLKISQMVEILISDLVLIVN